MVSTFTPNIQLEEPARGDQVGTWDTPVNTNMTVIDLVAGGRTTIGLNNSPVVLSAAQYECKTIVFNSTLTGSVAITFPTSFVKSYEIFNQCTGSSAFTVTLLTTAGSASAVCAPPGEIVDIANLGGNMFYKNLGRVGSYWDYAGSSVPAWVSGCTVPPYLNCDGSTFSATTYPSLAVILGSTTLPDSKGRARFALDQSAGRISSGTGGFSGPSVGGAGGGQTTTLGTSNLPAYTPTGTILLGPAGVQGFVSPGANVGFGGTATGGAAVTPTASFSGVAQGGVSQAFTNLPPAYIGGLTMIRSA